MACCKACCGCKDCAESEQGKCCCGGSTGECCTESEYCCNGVCQPGPCCECACPNLCGYAISSSLSELTTTATAAVTPADCESCLDEETVEVANPKDAGDQTGASSNYVRAVAANNVGFGIYAYGQTSFSESYGYGIGTASERLYDRSGSAQVSVYCSVVNGVVQWRVAAQWTYAESESTRDATTTPSTPIKTQSSSRGRSADIAVAIETCGETPDITVVIGVDDMTVNGTAYPLADDYLTELCQDWNNGTPTPCQDYLANYPSPTTFTMTWTGDCPGPCDTPPP